jgi:hypothetical protein
VQRSRQGSGSAGASPWDGETVLRTPEVVLRTPPHRDKACSGCQSPGNDARPRGPNRIRNAPKCYRPIDIDRTSQDFFVIRSGSGA